MARAAGIKLTWDDFADLSDVVPLLARIYPNGNADVNHFHAAGGMAFVIRELLDAGLLHEDVLTVAGPAACARYHRGAVPGRRQPDLAPGAGTSRSTATCCAPVAEPVQRRWRPASCCDGNLGRAVIKISAVKPEHRVVEAPALRLRRPGRAASPPSSAASWTATSSPSCASRAPRPTACRNCTS